MPRYAAIDIGSNSIRMEAAEVVPGQPARVLASEHEVTRLGESVFRTGSVGEEPLKATCAVTDGFRRARQKSLLVAGVADGVGGHRPDAHHVQLAIDPGHAGQQR